LPRSATMRVRYVFIFAACLAAVSALPAQAPPAFQPSPFPTPLYRMDDVARALELSREQTTRLNDMTERLQNRYRADLDRLSERERATRTPVLVGEYRTDWMK